MQNIAPNNLIEISDLCFSYEHGQQVLCDITLSVAKGDYLGIIGPNGAGKTTLLKMMLGLLSPSVGFVKLFGTDVKEFKNWPKIGYVPQKATNFDQNFPATVFEVVLMGRYGKRGLLHKLTHDDPEIAEMALRHVSMWDFKDRLIGDLSGGQQQRVFIARALATEPEIIFLDEPTTGVDQKAEYEFFELLRKLNKDMRLTLVLISHDIGALAREAKHIALIDKKIVFYGTPDQFLADSHAKEVMTYHPHH